MSAITENPDEPVEVIQVLFALHPNFGAQELCGPLEVLSKALQKNNDPGKQQLSPVSPTGSFSGLQAYSTLFLT